MLTTQDLYKKTLANIIPDEYESIKNNFYSEIPSFLANHNHAMSDNQRAVMTNEVSIKLQEIFDIMKLDFRNDPNLKDTPHRIASMWTNELMIGRYIQKPRLEAFPREDENEYSLRELGEDSIYINDMNTIVIKKIDIRSLCSHHFMPFFTEGENSYGVVAYIPTDKYLGISKIQRLANWLGARPQLQENLTNQIHTEMCNALGSNNVFVYLKNLTHTCETLRGAKTECGSTTTARFSGIFNDNKYRKEVISYISN